MSNGAVAVGVELLQAVAELAGLAPVAAGAEAADDQIEPSGPIEHAADAGLEALGHAGRARPGSSPSTFSRNGALQAAVGHVADEHLAGVRALLDAAPGCSGSWRSRSAASTATGLVTGWSSKRPGVPSGSVVKWL